MGCRFKAGKSAEKEVFRTAENGGEVIGRIVDELREELEQEIEALKTERCFPFASRAMMS